MKTKFFHFFIATLLGLGFMALSNSAQAYCKWVDGYWRHGYWYSGTYVCTDYGPRCKWVGGYYGKHGRWHPGYRVCYWR